MLPQAAPSKLVMQLVAAAAAAQLAFSGIEPSVWLHVRMPKHYLQGGKST